jgi:hypothetical protein
MPPSRKPGPEGVNTLTPIDTGTLNRQQTPPPGPVNLVNQKISAEDEPISGSIPASLGAASALRIPVSGTNGLAVELSAGGWTPKGGSTSSLFIQDITGRRHLRLDYGYNKASGLVEWHWNQKGTNATFGINNHTPVGTAEQALGQFAKYYKYAGRVFLVAGAAIDIYSIVTSSRPLRRSVQVVSGWAAGAGSCEAVGAGGATLGTAIAPGLGTAIGGLVGCALGAFIGYRAAEAASGYLYDWTEDTVFTKLSAESEPKGEFVGGGGRSGGGGASATW